MSEPVATRRSNSPRWIFVAIASGMIVLATATASRLAPSRAAASGAAPAERPERAAPSPPSAPAAHAASRGPASARRVALGEKIFSDKTLSEPAGTSCASCHDPAHGFAGNNGSTIGVARGSRSGHFAKRNTPSVLYLAFVRPFHLHWEEDAPLVDAFGGFFWDGRTDSLTDLVLQPLLAENEMNNGDPRRIADKLAASAYADDFRAEFPGAASDPTHAMTALGQALEAYLTSPAMSPFSSRYDDYIRGNDTFSAVESRGLRLFKDSSKGGCASCHKLNDTLPDPARSLFTDYGYEASAPPRNRAIPENRDPSHFDLGLCQRPDTHYHTDGDEFCGRFRTPSLRNVAVRQSFMHNGAFSKLRDVVSFYATRGTNPEHWYRSGVVFEDLPAKYRENVNVDSAPYNRQAGERPPLDDAEIDAIVAFLGTLTDAPFR